MFVKDCPTLNWADFILSNYGEFNLHFFSQRQFSSLASAGIKLEPTKYESCMRIKSAQFGSRVKIDDFEILNSDLDEIPILKSRKYFAIILVFDVLARNAKKNIL